MDGVEVPRRYKILRSFLATLLLFSGLILPFLNANSALAYTLVTSRKIVLSSSKTSDTNVAYDVYFTTAASYTVGSVVINICTDPFIGTTCTTPDATFDWNKNTNTIQTQTGITGLSIDTTNSTANSLVLTRTAGSIGASVAVHIELGNGTSTGATNPSTLGTFYARIETHSAIDGSGSAQDAGGVALSTANQLTITAKVQETLTFCVMTSGSNCAGASGTSLALGDGNGVLSSYTTNYTGNATFSIASNAQSGVSVAMKGDTLTTGAFTISASGSSCTADDTTATVEQFGMRISTAGAVTAIAPYNCSASNHGFDTTATTSTYGDQIATTSGPNAETLTTMEFMAKAATTTEAGIYTTTLTFIATGTY